MLKFDLNVQGEVVKVYSGVLLHGMVEAKPILKHRGMLSVKVNGITNAVLIIPISGYQLSRKFDVHGLKVKLDVIGGRKLDLATALVTSSHITAPTPGTCFAIFWETQDQNQLYPHLGINMQFSIVTQVWIENNVVDSKQHLMEFEIDVSE